jgi:hypothetical protein
MSAIASCYVIPAERLPDIVAAAPLPASGWFRRPSDRFWDVLRGASRELESFAGSGWVFNPLDLYLESRHGLMLDDQGDAASSAALSSARGSHWLVLPETEAATLRAALADVRCETPDVTEFVVSEHGADDADDGARMVQAALATLKAWLSEVRSGQVGLLSIG